MTVRTWDAPIATQRIMLTGHIGAVTAVSISPDGNWIATASRDRTIRIWDAAVGAISATMRVDHPLEDCVWSPSGALLAAGGDGGLYLFTFKH